MSEDRKMYEQHVPSRGQRPRTFKPKKKAEEDLGSQISGESKDSE